MKLNKQIFNAELYEAIRSLWLSDCELHVTVPPKSAMRRWFMPPDQATKDKFDHSCRLAFQPALDALSPPSLVLERDKTGQSARDADDKVVTSLFKSEIAFDGNSGQTRNTACSNALSLVLLLDQIPRNIFRSNQSIIYSHFDRLANALVRSVLATSPRLDHAEFVKSPVYRMWFYLPLMHSEDLQDHETFADCIAVSRAEMEKKDDRDAMEFLDNGVTSYEKKHVNILKEFGRYPYRNEVLGRETTEAEKKWEEAGGERFTA